MKKLEEKRVTDRDARTFHHAGIEMITQKGLVNLTREMANTLKKQINQGYNDEEEEKELEQEVETWKEKPIEKV